MYHWNSVSLPLFLRQCVNSAHITASKTFEYNELFSLFVSFEYYLQRNCIRLRSVRSTYPTRGTIHPTCFRIKLIYWEKNNSVKSDLLLNYNRRLKTVYSIIVLLFVRSLLSRRPGSIANCTTSSRWGNDIWFKVLFSVKIAKRRTF